MTVEEASLKMSPINVEQESTFGRLNKEKIDIPSLIGIFILRNTRRTLAEKQTKALYWDRTCISKTHLKRSLERAIVSLSQMYKK